jgi:hypothetical protein
MILLLMWVRSESPAVNPAVVEPAKAIQELSPPATTAINRDTPNNLARERNAEATTAPAARPGEPEVGWIQLGRETKASRLESSNQNHDGSTTPSEAGGLECHALQPYPGRPELYAYFRIDPHLKTHLTNQVVVELEYFDSEPGGHFRLDYDSFDESNRSQGAYTQSKERVNFRGTERWRTVRFLLDDARFEGRQNDQSDFRIAVVGGRFFLRSVKVQRDR